MAVRGGRSCISRTSATAIRCALEAPADAVNGEIFNVGQNSENYRVREIAQIVADVFPGCELTTGNGQRRQSQLPRSFDKIAAKLPGFSAAGTRAQGAEELRALFEQIDSTRKPTSFARSPG